MSDNPMYWPGHQRPAWHQQPPPSAQPVNSITHYATHPGNMLGNPMAPGIPGDPSSLQMQSSIPGRHQSHQSTLSQHQSTLAPPGAQSTLYQNMMPAPGAVPSSARPTTQLTTNSHLSSSATQGIPPHPSIQQPPHPQSHYPHQYSSLASSYWNPSPMNSQSTLGPSSAPGASGASQGAGPPSQSDGTSSYHSSSASPLAMPNESRGSISTNSSASMQQTAPSFHSPKDIQSSSDHMMSYDRQRASMAQQQHPSAMMSQNVPSSSASNLSPTQSQLGMQGRLQSQSQLDSMRSMSQQQNAVSNWSGSYYAQPSQSPYSSVMNPYMPYSGSSAVPNHAPTVGQPPTRPAMGQKSSTNGSERARTAYPPHGTSLYGQPPPSTGSTNGSYYGYDSYYNQVASQASSDPYLSHPNSANASQHWPSSASSNQMISNSSSAPGPLQPQLRPQTGSSGSNIHPQSPSSSSSSLPSLSSRPQPPASQTPDRSPAPQHPTSYPSPNQQGSSSKSTSSSLAQLEQMVMPNSGQSTTQAIKSPSHRSSTSSPSANSQQQQLQYSYNSSGQGSYFSTGSSASSNQASYYPSYESGGVEMHKPGWSDQAPGPIMNLIRPPSGSVMMDGGQSSYGQSNYDGTGSYGDYTSLSTPNSSCGQPRFATTGDSTEPHQSEKGDPYAIDSQTFDDYDEQSSASRTKKGRAKKGEEKVKKERKPRAPRAPKAGSSTAQPLSPVSTTPLQALIPQSQETNSTPPPPPPQPSHPPVLTSYPSPNQQSSPTKPSSSSSSSDMATHIETVPVPGVSSSTITQIKSPIHRLSTESPNSSLPPPPQYAYGGGNSQAGYFNANACQNQTGYYPPYEPSNVVELQKPGWSDQSSAPTLQPPFAPVLMDCGQSSYGQSSYDSASSYGEYTSLSTPSNSSGQPRFLTTSDIAETTSVETDDLSAIDAQVVEDSSDQPPSSKPKKSRSKKGEEKVKKERKPRTAKVPQLAPDQPPSQSKAGSSGAQSPLPPTSVQPLVSQIPDTSPTPPPSHPPVLTSFPSPNQQSSPTKPSSSSSSSDMATHIEIVPVPGVSSSTITQIKSPIHRLSTESPNSSLPPPPQYAYGGGNSQAGYFNANAGQNQTGYYPPYEPSNVVELQKPGWSDQSSAPTINPLQPPSGPVLMDCAQSSYGQSSYDGASSYGEYTSLSTPSNSSGQPRFLTTSDIAETTSVEIVDASTIDTQVVEDSLDPPPISKPKKSRSRKSQEKVKKERKPRAARVSQPAPDQPSSPPLAEPTDDSIEPQASQSTSECTPVEPKPKRIRIRDATSKGKKKLPKFALKFAKTKKRKRLGSSDNDQSDLDKTPPPSPDEVESGVQKRRSARNTKKLKYNDDIELGFSDSDDESQILPRTKKIPSTNVTLDGDSTALDDSVITDEPTVYAAPVEDTMVVEKIMSSRMGQRELEPEPGEVLPPDGTHIEVEEFYVKYKNLSYLHCDWRTLEELEKGDRRIIQKIKRYKQKKDSSNIFSFMDEEPFDLQYCEVDRILAVNEVEEMVPDSEDDEEKVNKKDFEEKIDDKSDPEEKVDKNDLKEDSPFKVHVPVPEDSNENTNELSMDSEIPSSETAGNKNFLVELIETSKEDKIVEKFEKLIDENKDDNDIIKGSEFTNSQTKPEDEKAVLKLEYNVDKINDAAAVTKAIDQVDPQIEQAFEKPKKMKKKISRHYLVKWRGLSYEESTWELEDDLDQDKIKHFMRFKDPPPKSKWRQVKRPKPEDWVRKEASPVYKNNNTLREYQLEGINWLSFCWHQGRNCILADEMGLGKTIQSIAFVNEIYQHGINGPFLIIVPLSTVGNWAREFETWTDLNVITYHGGSTSREMLKEYEMFYRNEQGNRIMSYFKFQVMITTFEIILSDCLDLREIPWKCCIIDEAHRLKNRNCKLLEGLRLLNMEHRVLLTGTPLQNNVEELFSLLNFLEPSQFASTEQFLLEFGDLKTEAQVDKLKLILKPMMLRRLKEDVEKTLAPKEETIVEVELTNIQKKYYRAILEKNFSFLSKGSSSNNNMPNLMNTMMELRKCCIHPYLINGAEEQIMYEARQTKLAGSETMSSYQAMVNSSGKLVLIDKLLPRLRADGHRVLIFSQMVRCLDILEDYVTHKHYPFERIDGRVRGSDRQQAIDRFSKPGSDRFVFLLCTRAGGLGINLTAADTVIIFDSDWNPQNDLQAQARCHRIGQSKAVKIYRLICRNTYEREMFDKASLKLGLDKAVLQSMNTQKGGPGGLDGQLTKKEIEELLRKGAYGALMDDDNAGDKFCEEDIDQILQRRTQVITIDNSEAKGSTFSKATFSSSNNREDIELDDPNFWEKWAKKANIDSDETRSKDELIQLAPRRRTQTKRYGADGNLLDISDLDSSEEDEETISMRTRGSRGRQPKLTPSSATKRSKRNRFLEFEDDEFMAGLDTGVWSKGDCLKVEKGLLTFGWGRWYEIIASNSYKRELTVEECESICRVILLYCLNSYKGDEKIKSFAWELITPPEESDKMDLDLDVSFTSRCRKPKPSVPILAKKSIAEEIADATWPKEAKNDPLITLPDDQYRRHLQRNSNRLLIRVKFLHYLKNDILKGYNESILADCNANEIDLPAVPVDGDLPASWWDDEADKSLLVGIFKHGHDKFNLMRQDPTLCFLQKCGPPNKDELMAEMNCNERSVEDLEEENRDSLQIGASVKIINEFDNDADAGELLDSLVNDVVKDLSDSQDMDLDSNGVVDENKNSILKCSDSHNSSTEDTCENGVAETGQTVKMDITDDESSLTNEASIDTVLPDKAELSTEETGSSEFLPFPSANDLNQRFRRLITAYQRNSKKLEIKLAQKARDELKKERTSKFEAAKNEREERKRFLAQKWSRREEADFFRAISSFGVEYDSEQKRHDWNKFRSIGKLEKKLDETLEEYYKAFVIMCKKVTSRPLTADEEKCLINVDTITEERASRCLFRIEFLNKIREQIINHPELEERLKLCHPQSDLPDWWENGRHDKDLLLAAAKHGLTRLDYNLAHDPTLSFDSLIRQKAEYQLSQPPTSILIPLEQLQELLERNGIEYLKDLDLQDDLEDIKAILNSILDNLESEESVIDSGYKSFAELVDGPHSKVNDESIEKSLLAVPNIGSQISKTSPKTTRSSVGLVSRPLPNILARRVPNTNLKSAESTEFNSHGVRLTSLGHAVDDRRVIEITPIRPDKIPEELTKNFEAGEISLTIQSESALLQLDDREPIVLFGATNPITAKIRWPKDKAIQTRLENLVYLVEKNEWPSPPKPSVPTITLPNHLTTSIPSAPLTVATSSPAKNEKSEIPIGSPKSDISNISSRTSKQDSKERSNDLSTSRGRRGRGRRPRQSESEQMPQNLESPKEDRQAAAKLRNLLSQGPSSTKGMSSSSGDKLTAKFGGNKQGAGLSSLLASFKQKRAESSGSSRGRDDKNMLDLNAPGTANLLPQILANMKPEFRDLLANQDAATLLLNSLTSMAGSSNIGANLRSSNSSPQVSIDNLLNASRSSSKGPPPAHQRSDNPPSAHGNSSARELKRNSQSARENSPPSTNLRSTRGKGSLANLESVSHQKSVEMAHSKLPSSKKRGRPSSSTSESPPCVPGADILDLSSLPITSKGGSVSRCESKSRRHRDQSDDLLAHTSSRSSSGVPTKANLKAGTKQTTNQELEQSSDKGIRTTRASKRIGSRIDALALNLQAKKLNRGESPSADLSPSLPKKKAQESPMAAHGNSKSPSEHKSQNSKAPPAAHSGSQKSSSSSASIDQQREKANPIPSSNLSSQASTSATTRQDPLAQYMSNPASLLAGLNPTTLGGAGDLMNQLLRKPGTNDIVKNLLSEFMKNPSLALDPNILATLTASLPMNTPSLSGKNTLGLPGKNSPGLPNKNTPGLSGFNLPTQSQTPTTLPPSSLLNDFKSPSSNSLMKRYRPESTSSTSRHSSNTSSSTPDRHERRSSSTDRRSSDKHGKHDKRSSGSNQQESSSDASSRRSSSSLLAQVQTSSTPTSSQSSLPNTATLNLANQFGGLLGFPGMNELMKQMSNFPGLAGSLPRVSSQPNTTSNPYSNYANPLANPFLPFSLANLGMNNPLGMGLFHNLYMPPGFPTPDHQQQPQQPSNQGGSSDSSSSKDKKMRYPKK